MIVRFANTNAATQTGFALAPVDSCVDVMPSTDSAVMYAFVPFVCPMPRRRDDQAEVVDVEDEWARR